jgi:hypothetical protein
MALGYQAPVVIIQLIIEADNSLASEKDMFGATPLHIACLNGAPHDLIDVLLQHNKNLAREPDFDKRVPLHHAVEYFCQSGDSENTYIDVIRKLSKTAPEMVHCRDKSGESPIDLVQFVKSQSREPSERYQLLHALYAELRKTSIRLYRENKKRWELEGYMNDLHLRESELGRASTTASGSAASSLRSDSLKTPASGSMENDCSTGDGAEKEVQQAMKDDGGVELLTLSDDEKEAKRRKFIRH